MVKLFTYLDDGLQIMSVGITGREVAHVAAVSFQEFLKKGDRVELDHGHHQFPGDRGFRRKLIGVKRIVSFKEWDEGVAAQEGVRECVLGMGVKRMNRIHRPDTIADVATSTKGKCWEDASSGSELTHIPSGAGLNRSGPY